MIDISKMNKAEVLMRLYNASQPLGLGFLHYTPDNMTLSEAEHLLKQQTYFDYLKGRVMKINLKEDVIDPQLYDRDNGQGSAALALGPT